MTRMLHNTPACVYPYLSLWHSTSSSSHGGTPRRRVSFAHTTSKTTILSNRFGLQWPGVGLFPFLPSFCRGFTVLPPSWGDHRQCWISSATCSFSNHSRWHTLAEEAGTLLAQRCVCLHDFDFLPFSGYYGGCWPGSVLGGGTRFCQGKIAFWLHRTSPNSFVFIQWIHKL